MALGAVFFSLPAALFGALFVSFSNELGMIEAFGVYAGFGLLTLLAIISVATLADIKRA